MPNTARGIGQMNVTRDNEEVRRRYGVLLKKQLPRVIRTEEENDYWIKVLEQLDEKDPMDPEEQEFANLLTVLIEDFEDRHYALRPADPIEVLQELMSANGLKQRNLLDIFKTESIASEVLNRKRPLTKEHIEKLIRRFHIPADLFFPRAA